MGAVRCEACRASTTGSGWIRDAEAPVGYTEAFGFTLRVKTRGLEPIAAHLNDDASRDQFALGRALARSIGGDPHRRSRCRSDAGG